MGEAVATIQRPWSRSRRSCRTLQSRSMSSRINMASVVGGNIEIDGSRTTARPVGYFHRSGQGQLVGSKRKPQDRINGPFPAR
jgi:hypothetical protein